MEYKTKKSGCGNQGVLFNIGVEVEVEVKVEVEVGAVVEVRVLVEVKVGVAVKVEVRVEVGVAVKVGVSILIPSGITLHSILLPALSGYRFIQTYKYILNRSMQQEVAFSFQTAKLHQYRNMQL
jgi:hypothetical protein